MKDSLAVRSVADDPRELGYPTHVYPYTAGIVGGLLGGAVMVIPALIYGFVSGYGPWYPVNLIAATVLPQMQTMTPQQLAAFDPAALLIGLAIHLFVATALGLIFAMLLPTLPGHPVWWAIIIGPLLWIAATIVILPVINPIMAKLIDLPSFGAANILYGLVMGLWVANTPKVASEEAHLLRLYLPNFLGE